MKEFTFLKLTDESKKCFLQHVEQRLNMQDEKGNLTNLESAMEEGKKQVLERTIRKRIVEGKEDEIEPVWVTNEIKKEISQRRIYNKLKRNSKNAVEKRWYEEAYHKQKGKVQMLVEKAYEEYEKNRWTEIMNDRNRYRKVWEYIDMLREKAKQEMVRFIYMMKTK